MKKTYAIHQKIISFDEGEDDNNLFDKIVGTFWVSAAIIGLILTIIYIIIH